MNNHAKNDYIEERESRRNGSGMGKDKGKRAIRCERIVRYLKGQCDRRMSTCIYNVFIVLRAGRIPYCCHFQNSHNLYLASLLKLVLKMLHRALLTC